MPAIMIRPAVGSSEKVSGRISATPATGPRPGSTPIAVPRTRRQRPPANWPASPQRSIHTAGPGGSSFLAPSFRDTRLRVDPESRGRCGRFRCAIAHQSSSSRRPGMTECQNSHCRNTPPGICTFRSRTKNHSKHDRDGDGVDREPQHRPAGIIRQQPHAGEQEQRRGDHVADDRHHEEVERERGEQQQQPAQDRRRPAA